MKLKTLFGPGAALTAALIVAAGLWRVTGRPYPLANCIVSDEKLGSMGEPYVFVHDGQEIKLCCKGCLKDFQAEPAKFLKKLAAAPVAPAK